MTKPMRKGPSKVDGRTREGRALRGNGTTPPLAPKPAQRAIVLDADVCSMIEAAGYATRQTPSEVVRGWWNARKPLTATGS